MNGFAALDIHPHRRYVVDIGGRRSSRCRLHINFALFLHSLDFTQNLGVTRAFTLTTSILYYQDYHLIDKDTRELYQKAMAAFGGIAPSYHIELLDKPTIYWDFHSLLLGIQMMFSVVVKHFCNTCG